MGQEQSTYPLDPNLSEHSRCAIIVIAPKSGDDCLTELRWLPKQAKIIGTGINLEEFEKNNIPIHEGTVLLNVSGNSATLAPIIRNMPLLRWVHSSSAGVEHLLCPEIVDNPNITLTNAKGVFSSSLGEYVIGACLYFSKNIQRLQFQQNERNWDRFPMNELRGSTMGIIGYGDIGRSCAKLAKAFGMKVIALRRRPELSREDEYVDEVFSNNDLATVMSESDYLVICTALTPATRGMIGRREMLLSKEGQILINISRGAVIDELALIDILQKKTPIAGAALDVFTCEPLPKTSPLWELPNLLISPHNADMTKDFRHQSIKYFTQICHKFLSGDEIVDCVVDKYSGY